MQRRGHGRRGSEKWPPLLPPIRARARTEGKMVLGWGVYLTCNVTLSPERPPLLITKPPPFPKKVMCSAGVRLQRPSP